MTELNLHEGDVVEICTELFGDIKPYIITKIKNTNANEPQIRNSKYLRLRHLTSEDVLFERTDEFGNTIWALQNNKMVIKE